MLLEAINANDADFITLASRKVHAVDLGPVFGRDPCMQVCRLKGRLHMVPQITAAL